MEDALYFAQVARLAYRNPLEFKEEDIQLLEGGLPTFIDVNECQALIFCRDSKPNTLIVAFRGSDSIQDLRRVMRAHLKPFIIDGVRCGRVHAGFYDYYNTLRPHINPKIDNFVSKGGTRIVFVGHSLGACCVLAAMECAGRPELDVKCYTYGSPRIGDSIFSEAIMNRLGPRNTHRFVIRKDMITRMPSKSCGCCFFAHPSGGYNLGPPSMLRCFLLEIIAYFVLSSCVYTQLLKHHYIDCYVDALLSENFNHNHNHN